MNRSQDSESQFLDVPGGRLAYDVTGPDRAPLVLCVEGMGDVRQAFRLFAPALVEAGYRVARMDQRGHGESSSGWDGYGSPATGEDMLALVRHLGGPAGIIGHSNAAAAGIWAAAQEPELVRDPDFPDPVAAAKDGEALIGRYTRVSLELVQGAGHYPHVELPEATASAVLPFLAEVVNA